MWLWAIIVAYVLWGLAYIDRASFEIGTTRYFVLWDDAMVSMRYAENLVHGHGLVWNPGGDHVLGISNIGLMLLMVPAHLLAGPAKAALVVQIVVLGILAAVLVATDDVASSLTEGSLPARIASVLLVALSSPLAVWSLQGSDVPFVALVLLLAYRGVVRAWKAGRPIPLSVYLVIAGGVLLRHDTLILAAPIIVAGVAVDRSRDALRGVCIIGAVLALLLVWTRAAYGDLLPNTYYLKATGTPTGLVLAAGLRNLWSELLMLSPPLVIALVAGIAFFGRSDRTITLGASLVALSAAYDVWVGGDWLSTHPSRFVMPLLPELVLISVAVAHRAGHWGGARLGRLRLPVTVMLIGIAAWRLNPLAPRLEWFTLDEPTLFHKKNMDNARFGLWLREHSARNATVAVHWAGTPAYFAHRRAVDVLGKCDRHIARLKVDRFVPAHSKWDWDYVLDEAQPDIFQHVSRGLEQHPHFIARYIKVTRDGWTFWILRTALGKIGEAQLRDPSYGASHLQ